MIRAKRRREESDAKPLHLSPSNDLRPSSEAFTSPSHRSTPTRPLKPVARHRVHSERPNPDHSYASQSYSTHAATQPDGHMYTAAFEASIRPERDADIDEREDADLLSEIIMAVDMRNGSNVGCCYYVAKDQKLAILSDIRSGGLEIIDALKVRIQPTVVILSTRVDETVEMYFDPDVGSRGSMHGDEDQFKLPYVLESRPSPEFSYNPAIAKLVDVVAGLPSTSRTGFIAPGEQDVYEAYTEGFEIGYTESRGKVLRLSACIDTESRISIGCAGAALTYMGRRNAVGILPSSMDGAPTFHVSSVEMFSLNDMMFINSDTVASLQIIQSEFNPNSHSQGPSNSKGTSGSKEGLSVYGLFRHLARTPQGKTSLRLYFLRPSLNLEVINERLDTVSVFLRPDNSAPFFKIVKSMKSVKNMRTVMIHLRKGIDNGLNVGTLKSGIWSSLHSFAFHALQIKDAVAEVLGSEGITITQRIFSTFDTHALANIGTEVSEIVDFTTSIEMHRTVVLAGVDPELDRMKQTYDGIEDLLNQTSHAIAATVPAKFSLDLNVIFFPQIGFLISMPVNPQTSKAEYEGGDGDGRWDLIFSTAPRAYYKDYRMRELDESLGDMYAVICDREIEIVHELGQRVLQHEAMLNEASDLCGELDSLLALAQGAKNYKFCRPRMTTQNIVEIRGGRHPLQELTVPSYVANDIYLVGGSGSETQLEDVLKPRRHPVTNATLSPGDGDDGPSMLIMTGPNYSGKSVFLKQIAVIVYMAHVGCFVPADRATIGLTDKILTRIATRETISKAQSAFMIDLHQVSLAMKLATARSLVIIDEVGKGTDSSDGAGLACGVFEHFLSLGDNRPKVIGATHYHEIFENGFLKPRPYLEFGHMEVRLDHEAENIELQIAYLYNFRPGRKNSSFGSHCAAMNGVDPVIVNRSEELVLLHAQGEDLVAACAKISEEEETDLKIAERIARTFLEADLDQPNDPMEILKYVLRI